MERVEEARNNPAIPRQVMEVIDKNKQNAVGHSGSKYSELIETLLAIPWGKIRKIQVSAGSLRSGAEPLALWPPDTEGDSLRLLFQPHLALPAL